MNPGADLEFSLRGDAVFFKKFSKTLSTSLKLTKLIFRAFRELYKDPILTKSFEPHGCK